MDIHPSVRTYLLPIAKYENYEEHYSVCSEFFCWAEPKHTYQNYILDI